MKLPASGLKRRTLRIIGAMFALLAAYVIYDAARSLIRREVPEHSFPGIVIAALSLVVMPLLVRVKRRGAARLRSGALEAEARQTRVCAYLSAILLAGSASMLRPVGGGPIPWLASSWRRLSLGKGGKLSAAAPTTRTT